MALEYKSQTPPGLSFPITTGITYVPAESLDVYREFFGITDGPQEEDTSGGTEGNDDEGSDDNGNNGCTCCNGCNCSSCDNCGNCNNEDPDDPKEPEKKVVLEAAPDILIVRMAEFQQVAENNVVKIIPGIAEIGNAKVKDIDWSTDDPSIAKIEDSLLYGISMGETSATCVVTDMQGNEYEETFTIKVSEPISNSISEITDQVSKISDGIYNLNGLKCDNATMNLPKGIYIVIKDGKRSKVLI